MDVGCGNCGRQFQLKTRLQRRCPAAKCLCGSKIAIRKIAEKEGFPRRLGKYEMLAQIATGGMGSIEYGRMIGVEGFEKEVAVKRMLPHLTAEREFVEMMIKEAKLTVLLNHPNIVQVFDFGKDGAQYYLAMEYVPGVHLGSILHQAHISSDPLPLDVVLNILLQVLQGLTHAHEFCGQDGQPMQILHRDITPQNIIITRNGWAKIADFGIAKAVGEISTTMPGMLKGKLGYIAPEQISGKTADQRMDVFCAGILLWESLAGKRLFKGETEVDTFRMIADAKIPPLNLVRNDVPLEVEMVIHKALAADPDARFPSARAFWHALEEAVFPKDTSDFLRATQAYFAEHPSFFDSVASVKASAEQAAQLGGEADTTGLPSIVSLWSQPVGILRWAVGLGLAWGIGLLMGALAAGVDWEDLSDRLDGPPPGLTPLAMQTAVDKRHAKWLACYKEGSPQLRKLTSLDASFWVLKDGSVSQLQFEPEPDGWGGATRCLQRSLGKLRFAAHDRGKVQGRVRLPSPRLASPKARKAAIKPKKEPRAKPAVLSSEEIQATVQRHASAIARCMQDLKVGEAPDKVDARIVIEAEGRVSQVSFSPSLDAAQVSECLRRSFKAMRFRKHAVEGFEVTIPLKIQVL